MEGSKSEAVFESFNLKPQLLINEALNIVDDILDEAFNFFLREASNLLKTEGTDQSAELSKGVAYIQNLIQSNLDQRLQKWEEYCHRFCFHVPDEISLPEANELAGDGVSNIDALSDTDLDSQLKSLRDKLTLVEKESAELDRELQALEKQSLSSSQSAGSFDDALQLYREHNTTTMFQELTTMASELCAKLGNLKRRRVEESQRNRAATTCATDVDVLMTHSRNCLFGGKLEELQEFLDEISKSKS